MMIVQSKEGVVFFVEQIHQRSDLVLRKSIKRQLIPQDIARATKIMWNTQGRTQIGEGRRFRHGMMGRSASDFADKREVYLKHLPKSCTDAQLRERFGEPHGKVVRLWHAKNQETGESKGYAFLTFEKKETARYVVRNCNQHPNNYLDGKHVEISHAQPWEKHTAKTHIGLKNIEDREKSLTAGGGVKKKQGHKHKLSAKARQRAKKRKEKEMAERLPEEEMMMPK